MNFTVPAQWWKVVIVLVLALLTGVNKPASGETPLRSTPEYRQLDFLFRSTAADSGDVQKTIAALDTEYQVAVKKNDVAAMDHLLADDFTLVTGSGKVFSKADLLEEARSEQFHYEHQEDSNQTVRVWGNTAVISAKLWAKGTQNGKPFEYEVFFSDTYARTPTGWRYVFGQSSLPLPNTAP